jgi:hypothetical protein
VTNKQLVERLRKLPPTAEVIMAVPALAVERKAPESAGSIVRWTETAAAFPIEMVEPLRVDGAGTFIVLAETFGS